MDGDSHLRLGIWRKARGKIGGVLALACLLPLGSCAVAVPPEQVTYVEPRRVVTYVEPGPTVAFVEPPPWWRPAPWYGPRPWYGGCCWEYRHWR